MHSDYETFQGIDRQCQKWLFGTNDSTLELKTTLSDTKVGIVVTRWRHDEESNTPAFIHNRIHVYPNNSTIRDLFKRYLLQPNIDGWDKRVYIFPTQANSCVKFVQYELKFFPNELSMRQWLKGEVPVTVPGQVPEEMPYDEDCVIL